MSSIELPPYTASVLKMMVSTTLTKMGPPPSPVSLAHRTALITGSNQGIGLACARLFSKLALSRLIMAVRSVDKGEAAAAPLRKAYPNTKIEVWALDMLSYDSVSVQNGKFISTTIH